MRTPNASAFYECSVSLSKLENTEKSCIFHFKKLKNDSIKPHLISKIHFDKIVNTLKQTILVCFETSKPDLTVFLFQHID